MATSRRSTPIRRTTAKARPTCQCPLCLGTVATANGIYPCRADTTIEYVIVNQGEYLGTRGAELAAKTELNAYRRDLLVAPIEQAAAEADVDAEIAAFVAEVAQANPELCACGSPMVGDGCNNSDCLNFPPTIRPALPPLAVTYTYPPHIWYSATHGGFVFGDCARPYATWIDADVARAEMLAAA